jgi:hypothetical protein
VDHQEGAEIISLAAERARRAALAPTREEYRGALFEWRAMGEELAAADLVAAVDYLKASGLRSGAAHGILSGPCGSAREHIGLELQFIGRERGQ